MGAFVDLADAIEVQLGVDLGGRNRLVAKQLLDDSKVGSALKKVNGIRVAQRMWANHSLDAGGPTRLRQSRKYGLP